MRLRALKLTVAAAPTVLTLIPLTVEAVPADPHAIPLIQPTGYQFEARVVGDEWCNRLETLDGYSIEQDRKGTWRYIHDFTHWRTVLGEPVGPLGPLPSMAPHLGPECGPPVDAAGGAISTQTPNREGEGTSHVHDLTDDASRANVTGTVPILFLLAAFSDRSGTYSEEDFARFIQDDIREYFRTVSSDALDVVPARESSGTANNGVIGWLNLGYKHPNTANSTGAANQQASKDALLAADRYVDFKAYDQDRDGYVDATELAVVVIVAGFERAYGMKSPSVWGHQWSLDGVGAPTLDGVVVGASHENRGGYAQFGEIHQSRPNDKHQATVGIMVHELGHLVLRMPDLYDTDGSSNGAGAYCLMSYGAWGYSLDDAWSGDTPVGPSAWVRETLGWSTAIQAPSDFRITAAGSDSAHATNTILWLETANTSEYFLLENREPLGYDRGLEGLVENYSGGIAIWHIRSELNTNRYDDRRLVDLEEADGGTTAYDATNLWFGGNEQSADGFVPYSSSVRGPQLQNIMVTGFSAAGETMTGRIQPLSNARR